MNHSELDNGQGESNPHHAALQPRWNRRTYATWTFLTINLLVWIAMEAKGGSQDQEILRDFGALFGSLVAGGEYWRLFTAIFIHVGSLHLIFNGLGLLIFGGLVERVFKWRRFVTIYLLAGLSGNVASYAFNDEVISAGASGAIFGILGALAAFYLVRRKTLGDMGRHNFKGLLVVGGLSLVFGYLVPGIDNWAHLGGLAGGLLLGLALAPNYQRVSEGLSGGSFRIVYTTSLAKRWWVIPVALVVIAIGVVIATPESSPARQHVTQAEKYLADQNYEMAMQEISLAVEIDPASAPAYYTRGTINAELGNIAQAMEDFGLSIRFERDTRRRIEISSEMVELNLRSSRNGY